MACPKCKCKTTYAYFDGFDGDCDDDPKERCAHCGHVFWPEDALEDEDD